MALVRVKLTVGQVPAGEGVMPWALRELLRVSGAAPNTKAALTTHIRDTIAKHTLPSGRSMNITKVLKADLAGAATVPSIQPGNHKDQRIITVVSHSSVNIHSHIHPHRHTQHPSLSGIHRTQLPHK